MNRDRMSVRITGIAHLKRVSARALLLLGFSVIIAAQVLTVRQVNANGPHVGAEEVFSGHSGPYSVTVIAVPTTGTTHMTVVVSLISGESPVADATVHIRGIGPNPNSLIGPVLGPGSLAKPNRYEASFPINDSGQWIFTVYIDGASGRTKFDFPLVMEDSGNTEWGLIAIILVVFSLAIFLILSGRYRKGRRSRQ